MKKIPLLQIVGVSFGLAIAASSANAAPGRNLHDAQTRFGPPVIPSSEVLIANGDASSPFSRHN